MTGVQRYAGEVIAAIDRLLDKEQAEGLEKLKFILLKPKGARFSVNLKHIEEQEIAHLERVAWAQMLLPLHSRKGFLVSFCGQAPLMKFNQSVVLHDAYIATMPQMFQKREVRLWSYIYRRWAKRNMEIVTISRHSKSMLNRYFSFAEDKLHVIGEGYEHILRIRPDEHIIDRLNIKEPYVLAVGGSRNKNFDLLMEVCRKPNTSFGKLVIAGKIDASYRDELSVSKDAVIAGYVTDAELVSLYCHATCLVFPSIEEGFGIPPLEAMALNCPVLAANTSALPETCGEGALYFNPYDAEELLNKMNQLAADKELREQLIQKGKANLQRFSWEKTAREILGIVRRKVHE